MRRNHIGTFIAAAREHNCKIVVREQNQYSTKYMGRSGFSPKPLQCKAKTAHAGTAGPDIHVSGLVADPTKYPTLYGQRRDVIRYQETVETWEKFKKDFIDTRRGFKLNDNRSDPRNGCVLFHGNYLYSDYDLKTVCPMSKDGSLLQRTGRSVDVRPMHEKYRPRAPKDFKTELELQVRVFVNGRSTIPLIQHGSEDSHPGFSSGRELCHVFLPSHPWHTMEMYG